MAGPLVVSAMPDPVLQERLDRMREAYFPAGRNRVPAHVSLFHQLPADILDLFVATTNSALRELEPAARIDGVRCLGRGVAYTLAAPGLSGLQAELAVRFASLLTKQDRQQYHPHITIQNKAEPAVARALAARLSAEFAPMAFAFAEIAVWHYEEGRWRAAAKLPWGGSGAPGDSCCSSQALRSRPPP